MRQVCWRAQAERAVLLGAWGACVHRDSSLAGFSTEQNECVEWLAVTAQGGFALFGLEHEV